MILMDRGQFICKLCNFSIRLMMIKYWLVKQLNIFWSKNKMVFANFFLKFGIQYALDIYYIFCILYRRLFIRWTYVTIYAMFLYDIMIVWGCFCRQRVSLNISKKNHPTCQTSLSSWFWLIIIYYYLLNLCGHGIV